MHVQWLLNKLRGGLTVPRGLLKLMNFWVGQTKAQTNEREGSLDLAGVGGSISQGLARVGAVSLVPSPQRSVPSVKIKKGNRDVKRP